MGPVVCEDAPEGFQGKVKPNSNPFQGVCRDVLPARGSAATEDVIPSDR